MDKFVTSTKKKYRDRLIKCEKQWPPCKTQKLIRLELVEQEQGQIHQRGKDEVVKRTPIAYSDLFHMEAGRKPVRKVLVEGDAGIGKTTFSIAASEGWANGKMFQQFELLLLLPLRQERVASASSISELLKLLHRNPDVCNSVASYLEEEEGDKALIIADGWDELDVLQRKEGSFIYELLLGDLLPFVSVILTSRQTASIPLHKLPCIDRLVEVCGFNKESIKEYIQSEFPSDQEKACRLLEQLEKNPLIDSICNIPLNCAIICHLWRTLKEALPTSMTELYTEIILNVILRNIRKFPAYENVRNLSRFDAFPKSLQESWLLLCQFAYHSLSKEKLVFSEHELLALLPQGSTLDEHILCFGLLQSYESIIEVGHVPSFHFLHLTFQEYLAALHFVSYPSGVQLSLLRRHANSESFNMVLKFFFGIGFRGIHGSKDNLVDFKTAIDVFANHRELTICHCAVEAKRINASVAHKLKSCSISGTLRFGSGPWRPRSVYDCAGIVQFLAELKNCNSNVEINFSHRGVGDKMITALAEVLAGKHGELQVTNLYLVNNKLTDKSVEDMFCLASSALQRLGTLNLQANQITATGIKVIALQSTSITSLNLSENPLGVSGMQILKDAVLAGKFGKLDRLSLCGCLTDDVDVNGNLIATFMEALAAHCHNLSYVDFSKNDIGIPGAHALGRVMSMLGHSKESSLSLTLNEAKLGNEGVNAFVKSIVGHSYILTLELKANNISSDGVNFLSEGFSSQKFASFNELCLDDNPLGLSGILAVGHMLSNSACNLKHLSLSKCLLSDEPMTVGIKEKQLYTMSPASLHGTLRLDYNNFSGAGIHILAGIMHLCRNVNSITTRHCGITSTDLVHLLDDIDESKSFGDCQFKWWDLTNNCISDSGVAALMKHASLFPELYPSMPRFDGNNVSKAMMETWTEALKKIRKFTDYTRTAKVTPDGCYHYNGDSVEVKGDVFAYHVGGSNNRPGLVKVLKQMSSSSNYFECEIISGGKQPTIGVGIGDFTYSLYDMPGWNSNGIGYHGDDGKIYRPSFEGLKYGPTCCVGDRMGCGVEFDSAANGRVNVFFTINGKVIRSLISFKIPDGDLYPLIGMFCEGDQVKYLGERHHYPDTEVNKVKSKVFIGDSPSRAIRSEPLRQGDVVIRIPKPGECYTSVDELENEYGKWLLVEREAMQPIGWIYAEACVAEDKQELPQEKESSSDILPAISTSIAAVKEPVVVKSASIGECGPNAVSRELQSSLPGSVIESFPAQQETNAKDGTHDSSSSEEYETPPSTPSPLPVESLADDTQPKDASDHLLTPSDLSKILSALWEGRSRWYNLGLELKVPPGTLEAIKQENHHVSGDCFRAMLYGWLRNLDPPPTWQSLSRALRSPTVEMGKLIKELPDEL